MNEQVLFQKIDNLIGKVDDLKEDLKEFKEDLKEAKKDIGQIKVKQENLSTNIGWIKVLFTIASSIIILLLGILIKLAFDAIL